MIGIKRSRERKTSIKRKLLVMIACTLIALTLVLMFVSSRFIQKSTNEALTQSMRETATIASDRVADYVSLKLSLVQSVASRIGALYADALTGEFDAVRIAAFETQLADMAETYGFNLLFAIDNEGYSRTAVHSDIAALSLPYYTEIVQNGKDAYFSDVATDTGALGGSVINISAAIPDKSGNRIGVLVAKVDAVLISTLVSGITVGENGSTFVMNDAGLCIAHRSPEMCFGGAVYRAYKDNPSYPTLNALWDAMQQNDSGFAEYDFNGKRLAAYDTIDGTAKWTIAVSVDESEFMRTASNSTLICGIIGVLGLLVAFFACLLMVNPITQRITAITERMERFSAGDLKIDIQPDASRDEIGRLTNATRVLITNIVEMIDAVGDTLADLADGTIHSALGGTFNGDFARIRTIVERNLSKLGDLVTQISHTAEEVSRGSSQIAAGATTLAQGSAEQARSIEELYRTVSELSAHAREIANTDIHYLNGSDDDRSDDADEKRIEAAPTIVDKLTTAMESIRQRLSEIRKIASAIDSISSETGMLALNASVEATHAGEYGRGFAVIAADVRELSEKCRNEAKNANGKIDSMMRAVERGNQVVAYTIESVEHIAGALAQVENALSQISSVIEGTAATSQESAAGSEELSAQAEVLRNLAGTFTYQS